MYVVRTYSPARVTQTPTVTITLSFIRDIPDGNNNWRGQQPTADQLTKLCASGMVKRILRLNGNGKDSGGVTIPQERAICDQYGIELHVVNVHA